MPGIELLSKQAGVDFSHIAEARCRTERELAMRRTRFTACPLDEDATAVLMGSWGRLELTKGSDADFMVLICGQKRDGVAPKVREVAEVLKSPPPGPESTFAKQVWLSDLVDNIGRDRDTNTNLTRRMLLLLESVAVAGSEFHERAKRRVLEGYLDAHQHDYRPPRFLLNDLVRYWRTIAVDFEGKMRSRDGHGWGLRNAKLRLSRKALFASGLFPVLECARYPQDQLGEYLQARLAMPPLDRIADAFVAYGASDAGVRALQAYDRFLEILDDPKKRAELNDLTSTQRDKSDLFTEVKELGDRFEAGLLSLLFERTDLNPYVREYLIF